MIDGTNPTLSDARLDRLMSEVMAERAEEVFALAPTSRDMTERIAGKPRFAWPREWAAAMGAPGSLALMALVALLMVAALAAIVVGSRPLARSPQAVVAGQVVQAVNARDPEALRALLAEDGVLEFPGIDGRPGREGQVYMSDRTLSEALGSPENWIEMIDRWGLEADLGSCRNVAATTISCAVRTRWHTVQVEIGESWTFDFDGERVHRLQMLRVDPNPPDRSMPLALADLPTWEAWLRDAHPAQAARMLYSGPDVMAHYYFRIWSDASPDEIRDSVTEYLETRP